MSEGKVLTPKQLADIRAYASDESNFGVELMRKLLAHIDRVSAERDRLAERVQELEKLLRESLELIEIDEEADDITYEGRLSDRIRSALADQREKEST